MDNCTGTLDNTVGISAAALSLTDLLFRHHMLAWKGSGVGFENVIITR
jgi:hypothetical protein